MKDFLSRLFSSRKFTLTIAAWAVVLLKEKLGITVSEETLQWLLGLLAALVLGESYRDAAAAKNGGPTAGAAHSG